MRKKHKQTLLWVFLGVIGMAMLAGMLAVILPDRYVSDSVMGTIVLMGGYALAGLIMISIARDLKWTTRIACTAMGLSLAVFLVAIWTEQYLDYRMERRLYNTGAVLLIIGLTCGHRLLIVPIETHLFWGMIAKRAAIISGAISGAIMIIGFLNDGFFGWEDITVRILGISLIVAAGSSIATGAIAIFGPKPGDDEPGLLDDSIDVTLTCPRCARSLTLRSNRDQRCDGCRLKLHIKVEEPRCACGYLLYQLDADTCPECGKPVEASDRWGQIGSQ